jgi:hypothetical protein
MNIERLYPPVFIVCAATGAVVGKVAGYGVLRGLMWGMCIAALPVFLLLVAYLVVTMWRPVMPVCRCGQTRYRDYAYVAPKGNIPADDRVHFRCPKCGRTYEKRRERFDELTADGCAMPYMTHTRWGRWRKAESENSNVRNEES